MNGPPRSSCVKELPEQRLLTDAVAQAYRHDAATLAGVDATEDASDNLGPRLGVAQSDLDPEESEKVRVAQAVPHQRHRAGSATGDAGGEPSNVLGGNGNGAVAAHDGVDCAAGLVEWDESCHKG